MPINMTLISYLGNTTSDSAAFLESGYITNDSLNNSFVGEVGCYSSSPTFSWDTYTMYLSAIFIGY